MKVDRKIVDKYIEDVSLKIAIDKKKREEIYETLEKRFNLPINITSDVITARKGPQEFSDFIVFCIISAISEETLNKYFTKDEIEHYGNSKFKIGKVKMPLVLKNMVQVSDDQWIGKTSAKEILKLSQVDLINYNENTQRMMRRVVLGEQVIYKISVNKSSVEAIRNSMIKGTFIPNPITLNLPETSEFSYSDYALTIKKLEYFDILDGYHRFVAMSQAANMIDDFDYEMELRIVNFPESKAQHFIYQEDQKTKMRKIDSDSFNQDNAANLIAKRLNEDPNSEIQGMLGRNSSKIPIAEFSKLVKFYYLKNVDKRKNERVIVNEIVNELREKLNYFMQQFPQMYDESWKLRTLCIVMFVISNCDDNKEIPSMYLKIADKAEDLTDRFFKESASRDRIMRMNNELMRLLDK